MAQEGQSIVQLREELQAWHNQPSGQIEEQAFTRAQVQRLAEQIEALTVDGLFPFQGHIKVVEASLSHYILIQVFHGESGGKVAVLELDSKPEYQSSDLTEWDVETLIKQAEQASDGDEQQFAALVRARLLQLSLKNVEIFQTYFTCWVERSSFPVAWQVLREIKESLPYV